MHLKCCFFYSREKCFMEPLKKVQVEGLLMFAEPQDLLGNLDELCYVCIYSFLILLHLSIHLTSQCKGLIK